MYATTCEFAGALGKSFGTAPTYGVGHGLVADLPADTVHDSLLVGPAIVASDKLARLMNDTMCDHMGLVVAHDEATCTPCGSDNADDREAGTHVILELIRALLHSSDTDKDTVP